MAPIRDPPVGKPSPKTKPETPGRSRNPTMSTYSPTSPLAPPVVPRKRSNSNEDQAPVPVQPAEPKLTQSFGKMSLKKAALKPAPKLELVPKMEVTKVDPVPKPAQELVRKPSLDSLSALELLLSGPNVPSTVSPHSSGSSGNRPVKTESTTPRSEDTKIAPPVRPVATEIPKNLPPGLAALSAEDYTFLKNEVMKIFIAELSKTKSEILQQIHHN